MKTLLQKTFTVHAYFLNYFQKYHKHIYNMEISKREWVNPSNAEATFKDKDANIFENHLNPATCIFIG